MGLNRDRLDQFTQMIDAIERELALALVQRIASGAQADLIEDQRQALAQASDNAEQARFLAWQSRQP